MAASVGRICGAGLLKSNNNIVRTQVSQFSTAREWTKGKKTLLASLGLITGGAGALMYALDQSVKATDLIVHPPKNPWNHSGMFQSLDHAGIRRGFEVFKQVCAACHSLRFFAFRHLVNVSHTEAEAKAEAEQYQIKDGPNEEGHFFYRVGKLSDCWPDPYENESAARFANNGAYPPDLSLIAQARKGCEDYLFALITGYCDPPAGVHLRDGQYFNPYFPGGAISMAPPLYDEAVFYDEDSSIHPCTSQLAKDVTTFLKYAAEPFHDERKLWMIKFLFTGPIMLGSMYYLMRHKWTVMRSRKVVYQPPNKPVGYKMPNKPK